MLVRAFKDLESQEKTKVPYKRFNDNMQLFGGAAHAMLGALVPIFSLKKELVNMAKKIREEGSSPWSSLDDGPDSLLQWILRISAMTLTTQSLKAPRML